MDYRRGEDRSDYTDRCRCFKRDQTTLENIKKGDGVSFATFYKKDLVPFGYQKVWNGDHTSAATFFQGTVQTLDDVSALRPDDFVENEDGEVYRVIAPIISDDEQDPKRLSRRVSTATTITLRRPDRD